jgi:hypothetical protein
MVNWRLLKKGLAPWVSEWVSERCVMEAIVRGCFFVVLHTRVHGHKAVCYLGSLITHVLYGCNMYVFVLDSIRSEQYWLIIKPSVVATANLSIIHAMSRVLVMPQVVNGFRIRRSCLLDKLFTVTILQNNVFQTMQPDESLVSPVLSSTAVLSSIAMIGEMSLLLVLGSAGFFCSQLCSVLTCSQFFSLLFWTSLCSVWPLIFYSRTAQKTLSSRVPFDVFYPPVASSFIAAEPSLVLVFTCVVTSVIFALPREPDSLSPRQRHRDILALRWHATIWIPLAQHTAQWWFSYFVMKLMLPCKTFPRQIHRSFSKRSVLCCVRLQGSGSNP